MILKSVLFVYGVFALLFLFAPGVASRAGSDDAVPSCRCWTVGDKHLKTSRFSCRERKKNTRRFQWEDAFARKNSDTEATTQSIEGVHALLFLCAVTILTS